MRTTVLCLLALASLACAEVFTNRKTGKSVEGELVSWGRASVGGVYVDVIHVRGKSGKVRVLRLDEWEREAETKARYAEWSQKLKDGTVVTFGFPTPAETAVMPRLRGATLAVVTIDCSVAKAPHAYSGEAGVVTLILDGGKQVPCLDLPAELRERMAAAPDLLKRSLAMVEAVSVVPGAREARWVGFPGTLEAKDVRRVCYGKEGVTMGKSTAR